MTVKYDTTFSLYPLSIDGINNKNYVFFTNIRHFIQKINYLVYFSQKQEALTFFISLQKRLRKFKLEKATTKLSHKI